MAAVVVCTLLWNVGIDWRGSIQLPVVGTMLDVLVCSLGSSYLRFWQVLFCNYLVHEITYTKILSLASQLDNLTGHQDKSERF